MKNLLTIILASPKKYLLIAILLIIAIITAIFWPSSKPEPIKLAQVKRGEIKSSVSASGVLTGKTTVNLKFKSSGKLAALNYKVGDSINKGDLVAYLDTRDLQISLQQAKNDYTAKQAAAQKAEDDVKGHSEDETFTQKKERTAAQAAQNNAYDAVKAAELAIQNSVITSPINGVVTQADFVPGQFILGSDTILQIVDWSGTYFDTEVDEADISKISPNQEVEITLDSYPDQIFTGVVWEILPQIQSTSSGATVVIARVKLNSSNIHLIKGLNGTATIITDKVANTILIPQSALLNDDTVLIPDQNKFKEVKVKTGLRSDEEVEILDGLTPGQNIVLNAESVNKK